MSDDSYFKPVIEKEFLIYEETDLPEKGWIQKCFACPVITSHTVFYKIKTIEKRRYTNIYKIRAYLCPCCIRKINNSDRKLKKFEKHCENFLIENFDER